MGPQDDQKNTGNCHISHFFAFSFKIYELKMTYYSLKYSSVENIQRIKHLLETWQFSCTSHNLISEP